MFRVVWFHLVPGVLQRGREVQLRVGVLGVRGAGGAEGVGRAGEVPLLRERGAEVRVRVREGRVEGHGGPERLPVFFLSICEEARPEHGKQPRFSCLGFQRS